MRHFARPVLFLLLALALVLGGQPALAKSSKSSFSSGGKTSSSSSSGSKSSGWSNSTTSQSTPPPAKSSGGSATSGWGNSSAQTPDKPSGSAPAAPTPAQGGASKPASGGSWSNSAGTSAASGPDSAKGKSSFAASGQAAVQKEASVKAYNDYKGKFAKPDNPVRDNDTAAATGPRPTRTWDNYQDYRSYRDDYYAGRGWSAPGYAYRSFPSFGIWDAMFLWFMLRQASGPSFLYNHQNDPGVQAFRQEADKLAASNADLKKQLAEVDAKVEQMRKDGAPVDPKRLEGVDPSVALAAEQVVNENPARSSRFGSWLWIAGAGAAVAVLFLLLTRRRGNTRSR
ncbi:MAG: hypothetical protein ACLGQH_01695 [Acidobacteriota bacterium]